jgi:hypothetical protein
LLAVIVCNSSKVGNIKTFNLFISNRFINYGYNTVTQNNEAHHSTCQSSAKLASIVSATCCSGNDTVGSQTAFHPRVHQGLSLPPHSLLKHISLAPLEAPLRRLTWNPSPWHLSVFKNPGSLSFQVQSAPF